jgi:hypothetical protein
MTQRDRGLLIVSVSGMRTWAAGLGSSREVGSILGNFADVRHSWMICEWWRIQRWKGGISCRSFSGYGVVGEWTDEGHTSERC